MRDLSLFNIGFRSENIYKVLTDYENGKEIPKPILEDSEHLILDSFKFQEKVMSNLISQDKEFMELLPLIFETFEGQSIDDISKSLLETQTILKELSGDKKDLNVKTAKDFFRKLSDTCLGKSDDFALTHFETV